ncbi:tyrosine-protein kinase SRK3-like [Rana temporaria]|uniref:tyrosine-protein kinase SRK3-like n=1 Tax=Rana temporaria TaxID=8407 RepID=UPI001AAD9C7E|nr:tyrosine-protein kinase SRK3-like [Rana temporaria]
MGQNICKRYCGCCCGCCRQSVDIPRIGSGSTMMSSPKALDKPDSVVDAHKMYRIHNLNPQMSVKLESFLKGEDNPGFVGGPNGEQPNPNGPTLEPPKVHFEREQVHTHVPGKGQAERLVRFSRNTKVSTYSYKPRSTEDLEVRKGEALEVLEEQGTWILARTLKDNGEVKTGYIPRTFLANAGSLEAEDWYFDLGTKMDAKRYLMQEQNGTGSFLVWKKKDEDYYYLSVREGSEVRNYRIQEFNDSYYLGQRVSFPTIKDLVQYYHEKQDGLCTKLDKPCVKLDLPPVDSISYTMVDQLEIDPTSIEKVQKLGRGQFGMVWLGLWNGTTEVAIKELQVTAESLQKSLQEEAKTMWRLNHERLLKLYAVCLKSQPVFIVTEYMKNGTLKRYLRDHQKLRDLEFHQLVDFAVQISQGMDYMEQIGCVHRDLRSENILLSAMMSCKIGDFGLARFMESSSIAVSAGAQIPIKWTAPEVFQHQKYSNKSDVWSFGVLLGEIMTYGKLPFPDKSNGDYRKDILDGKHLEPPSESHPEVSHIMEMCWRYQSSSRPSFAEVEGFLMDLLNPILVDDIVE